MVGAENHGVSAVEPEGEALVAAFALAAHLDRAEGGGFNLDVELLDRSDEHMASIQLAPEDGRKQADHRGAADRASVVIPGAVARDAHARISAMLGIPAVDRRQAPLVDERLQLGKAQSLQRDR